MSFEVERTDSLSVEAIQRPVSWFCQTLWTVALNPIRSRRLFPAYVAVHIVLEVFRHILSREEIEVDVIWARVLDRTIREPGHIQRRLGPEDIIVAL